MHPDENVHQVEGITEIVEHHPGDGKHVVEIPENCSANDKCDVIQDSNVDNTQPLKYLIIQKSLKKIDHNLRCNDMTFRCRWRARTKSDHSTGPEASKVVRIEKLPQNLADKLNDRLTD